MSKRWLASVGIVHLIWVAAGVPTASAQDPLPVVGLEEVIVTAQRRVESVNDVPMSIEVVGASKLAAMRIDEVKDLPLVIPSFTVSQSYQGVPTYTLRGIGFNTVNLSATSTVGTYVDEVAYAYPIMNTGPLFDLERVEVLKGPQGTLFGRNTTAGLINFVTKKPTTEFEGGASVDIGNYETFNAGGFLSGPITDNVQWRLAARGETSGEGWQRSRTRDEQLGEIQRYGVRGALAMQFGENTDVDLTANWWKNESDTVAGQGIGFTPATAMSPFNAPGLVNYIANNAPRDSRDADWAPESVRGLDVGTGLGLPGALSEDNPFMAFALRIDHAFSDSLKIVSLTSYNEFERNALFDWSGVPYEILLQNAVGKIESFAQDMRIEGSTDRVNWLLGGYFANDKILDSNRTILGQNANVGTIRFFGSTLLGSPFNCCGYTPLEMSQAFRTYVDEGHIDTETWSVYANADWQLGAAWKLTTGVRYTEDQQEYRGCSHDFNGNMLPNVNVVNRALFAQAYGVFAAPISEGECNTFDPATGSFGEVASTLDEDNVAWRVALDWSALENTMMFASVSRGAKSGTTPINPANIARQNAPVTQELLTAYEIGFKATLAQQTVQANASAFYYDYEDKQISTYFADPIYTALTRLDNVPKSNAYGIDADLTWQPLDGFTINLAGLWLQTEVEGYQGTNAAGQPQDYDGAEFIYSPEFQGSLTFNYDRPVSDRLALLMTLNGRYQTESNTIFEDIDLYKIPAYGLVNASMGLGAADGRWSFVVWSRNLLDEYAWSAVASNANVVVRFPTPPRTYGATFTFNF